MAYILIPNLPAVVTPVDTDAVVVDQGGVTKKETRLQVVAKEKSDREAADVVLTTNISNEAITRATQDVTLQNNINAEAVTRNSNDLLRVLKTGDTMTGALTLPAASPTTDNHASRKKYVDDQDAFKATYTEDYNPVGTTFPTTWNGAAIVRGQEWRISAAGSIISSDAVTVTVRVGDILVALVSVPAQLSTNWNIISNLVQPASETISGRAEIATSVEMLAFTDNTRVLTPLRVGELLDTIPYNEEEKNASFAITATDPKTFFLHTSAAAITATLPAIVTIAATLVQKYRIVLADIDGGADGNNITIATSGGNTINGATQLVINKEYSSITLIPRGNAWVVVGNDDYANAHNTTIFNLGGVQNVANIAETQLTIGSQYAGYNPFSQYDGVAYTFTPEYNGVYHISLQVGVDFVASHGISIRVKQGASVIAAQDFVTPAVTTGANGNRYTLNCIVVMSAGIAYDFHTWQNSGGGLNYNSGINVTRIIIKRISN